MTGRLLAAGISGFAAGIGAVKASMHCQVYCYEHSE